MIDHFDYVESMCFVFARKRGVWKWRSCIYVCIRGGVCMYVHLCENVYMYVYMCVHVCIVIALPL
jgi:hypothetical protein